MNNYSKAENFARRLWNKYDLGGGTFEVTTCANFSADIKTTPEYIRLRLDPARLDWDAANGFGEYKKVMYIWRAAGATVWRRVRVSSGGYLNVLPQLTGDKAIWAVVLHEFAHCMQVRLYGWPYKYSRRGDKVIDHHGWQFQQILKQLITENPYTEGFWVEAIPTWLAWADAAGL